jgi:hypothetical protein
MQQDHSTLKEWVTALLALIVVIGSVGLGIFAVRSVGDDKIFAKAKDLLLFVNPILGVVIGYYFSKTQTENVVKNAEAAADRANVQATAAVADKAKAETTTNQMRSIVGDLVSAAKEQLDPQAKTLGVSEQVGSSRLADAVSRAEALMR